MSNRFLNKYVKDCLRTESKLDKLRINEKLVKQLFTMYCELGEVLDAVKKSAFYGKDEKLSNEFYDRMTAVNKISGELLYIMRPELLSKDETEFNPRIFHGIIGIASESSELCEIWKEHMDGKEIDPIHVQEELGDGFSLGWYPAILHDELKLDPQETLDKNIRKLKIRFPDRYTNERAEKRNLEAERKELEK